VFGFTATKIDFEWIWFGKIDYD